MCLPQERHQQGPPHTQVWVPSGNFRCYAWKVAKVDNSLQNCKKLSVRALGRTPTLLSPCLGGGWGLSPWVERRPAELAPGGGTASSEGLRMARNGQKAFRGRGLPSKALLGEDSGACALACSPPGTRACGKGQLALSQLPRSLRCVFFKALY